MTPPQIFMAGNENHQLFVTFCCHQVFCQVFWLFHFCQRYLTIKISSCLWGFWFLFKKMGKRENWVIFQFYRSYPSYKGYFSKYTRYKGYFSKYPSYKGYFPKYTSYKWYFLKYTSYKEYFSKYTSYKCYFLKYTSYKGYFPPMLISLNFPPIPVADKFEFPPI